jgi:hypothetical protein
MRQLAQFLAGAFKSGLVHALIHDPHRATWHVQVPKHGAGKPAAKERPTVSHAPANAGRSTATTVVMNQVNILVESGWGSATSPHCRWCC